MDVSGDKLYFTDVSNHRVRAVDLGAATIATVAGGGNVEIGDGGPATAATLSTHPMRVMVDKGDLYITDAHQNRVRRVDCRTGIITTVAGTGTEGFAGDGGPATAARLRLPYSIALDRDQNLFIKDSGNCRIRRVDAAAGTISTIAGCGEYGFSGDGGPALAARLATGK